MSFSAHILRAMERILVFSFSILGFTCRGTYYMELNLISSALLIKIATKIEYFKIMSLFLSQTEPGYPFKIVRIVPYNGNIINYFLHQT